MSAAYSPSNLSSVTLVGSSPSDVDTKTVPDTSTGFKTKSSKTTAFPKEEHVDTPKKMPLIPSQDTFDNTKPVQRDISIETEEQSEEHVYGQMDRASCSSSRSASVSTSVGVLQVRLQNNNCIALK